MRTGLVLPAVAVLLTTGAHAGTAQAERPSQAPLLPAPARPVADQYIVVLQDGVDPLDVARRNGIQPLHSYSTALSGFAATLTRAQLAQVRRDRSVQYVEQDAIASASNKPQPPPSVSQSTAPQVSQPTSDEVATETTQLGATWGIDRVDQRTNINGNYNHTDSGAGVTAYVLDTGINRDHTEFGGRALHWPSFDAFGGDGSDCNGHGTHVAGTLGGATYGVAKGVNLVSVRVLDCSAFGSYSGIIAGIDWVTYMHDGPSVANMSLGGGKSTAVNSAVAKSVQHGVTYVVAAGNDAADACNYSPASAGPAITVGATYLTGGKDYRASWSNYGRCLDTFNPGVDITSAWLGSTTATNTISGTSMASPHVAGQVALYLQSNRTGAPATVDQALKSGAVRGIVQNRGTGSPNVFHRKWNGAVAAGGDSIEPDNSHWYQKNTAFVQAWLAGTPGTDPDLHLERWDGATWLHVTESTSYTERERVSQQVTGGSYYRWRVHGWAGSGSYDLWFNRSAI